jgi:hypothetical protein
MQQPILLSPKFGVKSSHIFMHSPQNITACMQNWLFSILVQILCEQSPWCQKMIRMSLTSLFTCLAFFGLPWNQACHSNTLVWLMLSSLKARLCLQHTLSEICTKFDACCLSDSSQSHIRPDTRFQIKGHKKSARPPNCVKFCTLTPKIC